MLEIKTFKNPKEALKSIDDTFDLIISDLTMPGMDGLDFVKELDGRFPVVIITGNATLNRAIDSIRLGVKDFITKPFEIQTLIDAIKNGSNEKPNQTAQKPKKEEIKTPSKDGFIAISKGVERAVEVASKAAATDASIILLGDSVDIVTGKQIGRAHV